MRRAEMARRRKNLSEKRNEEEKVCYLFSLLLCDCPHFLCFYLTFAHNIHLSSFLTFILGKYMLETSHYPTALPVIYKEPDKTSLY